MNIIQRALELQGIKAAWQGEEPADVMQITSDYLNEVFDNNMPRMVRAEDDAGKVVNIIQLRMDYHNLVSSIGEERRIAAIKRKAGEVINNVMPDWKQRNLMARSIELLNISASREYTPEEQAEVDFIQYFWAWVKVVRATSDAAENEGKQAYQITWPTFNG